jgi:Tfp pilus assembly protein PilF
VAPQVDALSAQVAQIEHARSLFASGDNGGALAALDAYDRRFGQGPLAEEALLLRIEVSAARGDRASVAALSRHFRAEYPRSVHLRQVARLAGDGAE